MCRAVREYEYKSNIEVVVAGQDIFLFLWTI